MFIYIYETILDQNGNCVSSPSVCAGNCGVCLPHHLHNRDVPEDRCLWSRHAPELLRAQRLEHVGLCHRRRGVRPVHKTQHNTAQHKIQHYHAQKQAHIHYVHTLRSCVGLCNMCAASLSPRFQSDLNSGQMRLLKPATNHTHFHSSQIDKCACNCYVQLLNKSHDSFVTNGG